MTEPGRFERIGELFEGARERSPQDRAEFLDAACVGDADLRREVERLLLAHDRESPLDSETPGLLAGRIADEAESGAMPEQIGPYSINRLIGEGGMGTVYEATRRNPDRVVALKIIKLGMDTRQVVARFEAERQALALMDHPGIASVHDAGATETGRPYFVMELVRGVPVTEYCRTQGLSTGDRLRLFSRICRAIQHAHQKGVIHRDIKPSNVLVAEHDGEPMPKVIDFGIAKATSVELTEKTLVTGHGQALGTPAYMSPEQAELGGSGVDTRADIYALGVLLYELLTGTTPFDAAELQSSGLAEMLRVIREVEPDRPSTRLSSLGDGAPDASRGPRRDAGTTGRGLSGDLDWIAMKCLEKDPADRYESAAALADDIERHLADEPVTAGPRTAGYRVRKFVRRNRAGVAATAALAAVLLLGISGTTWGLVWALDERERASEAAAEAKAASEAATEASAAATRSADEARVEAETAEELSRFFVLDVLSAVDPSRTEDRDITVREALRLASANIQGRFEGRPKVEGRIHNALAYLFDRLGSPAEAEPHYRREWELAVQTEGPDSFEAARLLHGLARSHATQGRNADAIEVSNRQLEILEQHDGADADRLRIRVEGNLGALLFMTGQTGEAIPYMEASLQAKRTQLGDRHASTLSSLKNLSTAYITVGRYEEALTYATEAYEGRAEVLGAGDPRTYDALRSVARTRGFMKQDEVAAELLAEPYREASERLGPAHVSTIGLGTEYANVLIRLGRHEEAESICLGLIDRIPEFDPDRALVSSLWVEQAYARLLRRTDRPDEAAAVYASSLGIARRVFTPKGTDVTRFLTEYGEALSESGRYEEAERMLNEAWELADRVEPDRQPERTRVIDSMVGHFDRRHAAEPGSGYEVAAEEWRVLSPR